MVSKKCSSFFYGGVQPIRFDVRDFYADSRGMHLSISASDPTIVDIYYMLYPREQGSIRNQGASGSHCRKFCLAGPEGL